MTMPQAATLSSVSHVSSRLRLRELRRQLALGVQVDSEEEEGLCYEVVGPEQEAACHATYEDELVQVQEEARLA